MRWGSRTAASTKPCYFATRAAIGCLRTTVPVIELQVPLEEAGPPASGRIMSGELELNRKAVVRMLMI